MLSTSTANACAIELFLDFTGRTAGTVSFNVATVFNSTGDRDSKLQLFYSTDGTTYTEITGTSLPFTARNNVAGSASISVSLPSAFNNSSTARLRFYERSTTTGGTPTGSQPKISIDNVAVTSTSSSSAPTVTSSSATSLSATAATLNGNVTADGGASVTDRGFVYKAGSGVTISDNKTVAAEGATGTGVISLTPTLSVDTHYYFAAYAINTGGTTLSTPELNFWTLANTPSAPTVNNPGTTTLDVAIGSGDGNPGTTVYAIHETSSGNYVQSADGSLGGSPDWQTFATWGTKTVTGLTGGNTYTFEVKAQNGGGTDTGFSATAAGTTSAAGCTPPTINTPPGDQTVCSGSPAQFTVAATGTTLTYQWRRDGTNLSNAGHYSGVDTATLTINPADATDAALAAAGYDCVVTENQNGPCTTTTSPLVALTINDLPAISAASGDQTTCENSPASYTVTATGTSLTFQWNLNGSPLSEGGLYAGVTTSNLVVTPTGTGASVSAANGYDCTVSGTCTPPQTSTRRALTVNATTTPDVTIAADTGTTICAGSTVIFTATPVNGGATPAYQWKLNGGDVGGNSATYTNATLADSDAITCVLTPSAEICPATATATSSGLTMTVNPSATPSVGVTVSPGLTNCSGTTVTFTAWPTNGNATPTYQWQTNGTPVSGATGATFASGTLANGTVVTVVMTPSGESCVSPATATSAGQPVGVNTFSVPGPADTVIFSENVGTVANTLSLAANTWANSSPITFTSTAAAPDTRSTTVSSGYTGASGLRNVFFTSTSGDRNLVISGINTLAYSSIQLTYGNLLVSAGAGDAFVVEVSPDGTTYTPLTVSQPTSSWSLITASGTIPSTANLRLRFSKSLGASYRLDDIKLTGAMLTPTNAIITASGPTTINYGSSVTLTANAGAAAYLWSTSETTPAITVTASGNYSVTITDANGCSASTNVTVTVLDPAITSQPASITNAPGENVSFTVAAVGTPALTYQWQHAGTNLPGAQSTALNLTGISFAEAGSYSVIVSNGLGSAVTSSVVTLTLIDPAILTPPAGTTKDYGTTATFSVVAAGTGTLGYEWRQDGVALPEAGHYSGTATSDLTVSPVAFADAGSYTVVVTSDGGAITSAVAVLTVNDPIIVTQPANQTNAAGTTASFTVVAAGTATVGYQWMRGVTNIPSANSATLSLAAVTQDDATNGSYSVVVSGAGLAVTSSPVTLTVVDAPVVLTAPASRTNSVGERTVFSVSSSGTLKSYQWRLNGVDISGATSFSYTNSSLAAADAGDYEVVITNLGGSVTSAPPATLTVIGSNTVQVAQWNFNSTPPDASTSTGVTTPATGSGTAALVGGTTASFATGTASDPAANSTDNSRWSTASYPTQGTGEKTAGPEFAVSTVGYGNVIVSWEQFGSGTASKYALLQYSTDGVTFLDTPKIITVNATATHYDYDFSGTAGVAHNANFKFRVVTIYEDTAVGGGNLNYAAVTTSYGPSGTAGFDMVTLFAQPLPTELSMSGTGSFCPESGAQTFGVSGTTETDVSYALKNDAATVATLSGTGSAISFSAVTAAGTYTVVGTRNGLSATMSGSATINASPAAAFASVTHSRGVALKLDFTNLTANVAGVTVAAIDSQTSASQPLTLNDASVATSTRVLIPAAAEEGETFQYSITTAAGCTATGMVTIHVVEASGQQDATIRTAENGAILLKFFGVLNTDYVIQRATDAGFTQDLTDLGPFNTGASGIIAVTDATAPSGQAFYRLATVAPQPPGSRPASAALAKAANQ